MGLRVNISKSFEMSSVTLKILHSNLTIFNIYRNHYLPSTKRVPPSKPFCETVPSSDFLTDFNTLITLAASTPHDFLITGDFNLTQHVSFPTHRLNHTINIVITSKDSHLTLSFSHTLVSPSDHFPIFTSLTISPPRTTSLDLPFGSLIEIN